jgi:ATP-dependent helicase/nuclease subunit A
LFLPALAEVVDVDAIDWLMNETKLGELMRRNAKSVRRELRVAFAQTVAPPGFADNAVEPLDRIMIRGRIDALVPDGEGVVLVDYKTDRVTNETIDARAEFYREQVETYRDAVAHITGRAITRVDIVFLAARKIRSV